MELSMQVYLDAWGFAGSHPTSTSTSHASSALDAFITNWTSPEFGKFVDELEDLVNDVMPKDRDADERSQGIWLQAERIWERVLELEVGFWPDEGEQNTMLRGS
jgi:formylaminopyrimidine deformylase / aminopyrimidine aminohydrolase